MQRFQGFEPILDSYDTFVIDLWGVMHHGGQILPEAAALIQTMYDLGKVPHFLSNAPRRADVVQNQLVDRGLDKDLNRWVHTSGEEGWRYLSHNPQGWKTGLVFEPESAAEEMHADLPFNWTEDPIEADFALVIGVPYSTVDLKSYHHKLQAMADKSMPLVCVNPDRWARLGDKLFICAGLIAQTYVDDFGGPVQSFGKPYAAVYDTIVDRLTIVDRSRVLAIGDLVETDIKGGLTVGFDTCLIEGGVLATQLGFASGESAKDSDLAREFERVGVEPTFVVPLFRS